MNKCPNEVTPQAGGNLCPLGIAFTYFMSGEYLNSPARFGIACLTLQTFQDLEQLQKNLLRILIQQHLTIYSDLDMTEIPGIKCLKFASFFVENVSTHLTPPHFYIL